MINTFIILLAGLLPTYVLRFSFFGVPTNLFEAGVWLLFICMLCSSRARRRLIDAFVALPKKAKLWALLFFVSAVVSTIYSPVLRSSLGILKSWIITPMIFGMLVSFARHNDSLAYKKIIRSLVYSGLIVALLGISQVNGFVRIRALYDVPNSLALFLVPLCIIAFWIGMQTRDRFYQGSALILFIAILGTQSLGAVLALAGAVITGLLLRRIKMNTAKYGVATAVCIMILIVFLVSGRASYLVSPFVHSGATNSATVRLQLWDIGIRLINQHPILGIGLGQFEGAYQVELHNLFAQQKQLDASDRLYGLAPEFVFRDPHNWVISFWLNMGLLGLVSFVGLVFATLKDVRRKFSFSDKENYYTQAVVLATVSILIFGLFDTIYWKNDLSALWWILIGLLV